MVRSDPPIEDQKVKMGVRTLVTLGVALAGVVAAAMVRIGSFADHDEIQGVVLQHDRSLDAHGLVGGMDAIKNTVSSQASRIERVETEQKNMGEDVSYIRARIDFLTEQSIIEGRQSPRARVIVERAASNVRGRASGGVDPLKGLDLDP